MVTETGKSAPWTEKYRPLSINDVLGHTDVLDTLKGFIKTGSLPHILLHGPPGTGKTTIVKAIASALYGKRMREMVLELNASDERGIEKVQVDIKTFTAQGPMLLHKEIDSEAEFGNSPMGQLKLVVLDEADQMTKDAQMALRRIIEDYSATCRFFIICNYMNKLIPAVQSRCTKFRMPPLKKDMIKGRIAEIASSENLPVTDEGIARLVEISGGDMRRVVNLMEACYLMNQGLGQLDEALGYPTKEIIETLKCSLLEDDFSKAYVTLRDIKLSRGYRLQDLIESLYETTVQDDWPNSFITVLLPRLACIQKALTRGVDERLQVGAVVAAFIEARFVLESISANNTKAKRVT